MKNLLNLPAPAKLNLFLHIVGRRSDGYHLLQSVFQLVDICDFIDLEDNPEGDIIRTGDISWETEKDLCYRAAKILKTLAPGRGVVINVKKNIPHGAGLGGGSSDAATVLIGLNLLWNLRLSRTQLLDIGLKLGADVPFFIYGQTAFVEGIGEVLTGIEVPEMSYHVIFPNVSIETKKIFSSPNLTRNSKLCRITSLSKQLENFVDSPCGHNDLEPVVRQMSKEVDAALRLLSNVGNARMSGSGSSVFVASGTVQENDVELGIPSNWQYWFVKGLKKHPLSGWVDGKFS